MVKNKSDKKTIWVYAVILFTSAFIVLLLTAYSQIKFNKNIDEYKNQISSQEKDKLNFQLNLDTANEEIKKLKSQVDSAKNQLTSLKSEQGKSNTELSSAKDKYNQAVASYEALIAADNAYKKGNIVDCAVTLNDSCNSSLLDKAGMERYQFLLSQTLDKAALELYNGGYRDFVNAKYDDAINKLQQSAKLAGGEYFSDDCYYFIAYSQYKKGNNSEAINALQTLLEKYPDSNYKDDAAELLNKL